ncbi:hypothetical protein [Kitasatospora sp. NPDC050467]|uniref:hypothetical protein n=1 Tax=unclassified Kitasatospora TaxID=2633591 RepID=UPI00325277D3
METVVLVFRDSTVTLGRIAELLAPLGAVASEENLVSISTSGSRSYLVSVSDPEAEGLFDEWPTTLCPVSPVAAFSLDYRDPGIVLGIVESLAGRFEVLVDTNYGTVVPGGALVIDMLRGQDSPPTPPVGR